MALAQTFPDVPAYDGVPTLNRQQPNASAPDTTALTADGLAVNKYSALPNWGIVDTTGSHPIEPDSFKSFEIVTEYVVSDYPQEGGAFQSYNKVQRPFEVRLAVMKGGTESERSNFLTQVQNAVASEDLYTVTTPEAIYQNLNPKHHDYRKTATDGVTLLTVEIWFEQIRVSATAEFSNTASPGAAGAVNGGAVQPVTPTPAESAEVAWG
jgi:hypothetical protein